MELFATSPVLVALIVGGFGIVDYRMRRNFRHHEAWVKPIKDQVVNDHAGQNLRDQVDRLEYGLHQLSKVQEKHTKHDEAMLQELRSQGADLTKYTTWSEVENKRLWAAIEKKRGL